MQVFEDDSHTSNFKVDAESTTVPQFKYQNFWDHTRES